MEDNNLDTNWIDYLMASFSSVGAEGLGLVIAVVIFFVLAFILFKILSFIVTTILMIFILGGFGLFLIFGTDVNVKNWAELKVNATDMLIVGHADGCKIYMSNDKIFEELMIDGWKTYLGACNIAKENLNKMVDERGFKKLIKTKENISICPMAMATSRSQLYLEMVVLMKTNDCNTPIIFKENVLKLNQKKSDGSKAINNVKEKILDLMSN